MNITVQEIELLAPSTSTAKNGRDLVAKNKFSNLKILEDGSLIWGECAGSGANPYFCSADYSNENKPVFRCNCPSKQFPCKHSIGLLYAFAQGLQFTVAGIPEEIANKRNKIKQREEKNVQEDTTSVKEKASKQSDKPKNLKSVIRKIEAQLSGIEVAQKLLQNIVQIGLSGIDATAKRTIAGRIQELGNYHIEGIQLAFNSLLVELDLVKADEYTDVINQLNYISALLKKSREYLAAKKENPDSNPELTSAIEEQIGYVWKLTELMKYGLYEENAEIIQLSYNSYDNAGRKAFVDEGYWFNLKSGKIYKSKNYRPYRALRYIKEDNTCFEVLQIPELFVYPGDVNPRARWESQKLRLAANDDRIRVINAASDDYAEVVKTAKSTIKNPLMEKNPVVLLKLNRAYMAGDHIVLEDRQKNKLTVVDLPEHQIYTETSLKSILPEKCDDIALSAMINNNIKTGIFSVTALSLIVPDKIIRLLY
jgi:predicted nucleic acid-binding Zn finger protein